MVIGNSAVLGDVASQEYVENVIFGDRGGICLGTDMQIFTQKSLKK